MHSTLNNNNRAAAKLMPSQANSGDISRNNNLATGKQTSTNKSYFYPTTGKVKQNYSNTTSSNNNSSLQQQSKTIITSTNALPIINTPTSLANLAQLSGITFLPINSTNQQSGLNETGQQITNHNSYQANNLPHQSTSNFFNNPNNAHQKLPNSHQLTSSKPSKSNLMGKQQSFNLNSVPSIHLLNHQISTTEAIQSWRQKSSASLELEDQLHYSRSAKKNGKRGQPSNNQTFSSQQNLNDVQIIPLSEGQLPNFSDISDVNLKKAGSNFDDMLSQPSLDSNPIDSCIDINGDSNNISLVKLMAILNNPALTITAVDSSKNLNSRYSHGYDEHDRTTPASRKLLDKQQVSITMPPDIDSADYYQTNDYLPNQRTQSDCARLPKNRVPQSAANLQVMQGSIDRESFNPICNRILSQNLVNSITNEGSNVQSSYKQSDIKQNWLSSIGSNLASSSDVSTCQQELSCSSDNLRGERLRSDDMLDDPTMLSTSVRNLMMQQLPSGSKNTSVSVQLMKHIANQAKDNDWSDSQASKSVLEPECILTIPKSVQQLSVGAKRMESLKTVTSSTIQKKTYRERLRTTKNRLYIPRDENALRQKCTLTDSEGIFRLNSINIGGSEEREVHLSEHHQMLDIMMSSGASSKRKSVIPEPDEIFINRSKRVMSKIDTMVERKKRRRFERICGRAGPKANNLEEQCMESDNEWSGDENMDAESACFIETQLPLEEFETEEKRNHLLSVGLVSRYQRNKLLVEQCGEKMKVCSPLALEGPAEIPEGIRRFVDTMVKTGGGEIQLRTDSNIKRNDLPLLEGLNRNTSRMKMSYMNSLGLEKRSKRTTLYKIKPNENNLSISNAPKQNDLIKPKTDTTNYEEVKFDQETSRTYGLNGRSAVQQNNTLQPAKQVISLISCREAMKLPSKNEYMRSLGLMAS